jgi:hypothetical protein
MIRKDMPYGDRFSLTVKDFGRKIVIKVNRGKAEVSDNGKLVTIEYKDSNVRGSREQAKS